MDRKQKKIVLFKKAMNPDRIERKKLEQEIEGLEKLKAQTQEHGINKEEN